MTSAVLLRYIGSIIDALCATNDNITRQNTHATRKIHTSRLLTIVLIADPPVFFYPRDFFFSRVFTKMQMRGSSAQLLCEWKTSQLLTITDRGMRYLFPAKPTIRCSGAKRINSKVSEDTRNIRNWL